MIYDLAFPGTQKCQKLHAIEPICYFVLQHRIKCLLALEGSQRETMFVKGWLPQVSMLCGFPPPGMNAREALLLWLIFCKRPMHSAIVWLRCPQIVYCSSVSWQIVARTKQRNLQMPNTLHSLAMFAFKQLIALLNCCVSWQIAKLLRTQQRNLQKPNALHILAMFALIRLIALLDWLCFMKNGKEHSSESAKGQRTQAQFGACPQMK